MTLVVLAIRVGFGVYAYWGCSLRLLPVVLLAGLCVDWLLVCRLVCLLVLLGLLLVVCCGQVRLLDLVAGLLVAVGCVGCGTY